MTVTSNIFVGLPAWIANTSYPSTQGVARNSTATYFNASGNLTTAIVNELRVDHDRSSPFASRGNLIENASTNWLRNPIMTGANVGTNTPPTDWVVPTGLQGTTRTITSTGTDQGIPYVDIQYSGTATAGTIYCVVETGNSIGSSLLNTIWSFSGYAKLQAGSLSGITVNWGWELWDTTSTTIAGGQGAPQTITPTNAALATQFISQPNQTVTNNIGTLPDNGILKLVFYFAVPAAALNFTIRIGAPQMEQGAVVTSTILPTGALPALGAGTTRAADIALIPRRVSNGGNAYQLIGAGTSGSGGPSGTGSSITDNTASWRYLGLIDFTSLSAWTASLPTTLTQPMIGQLWNCGPLTTPAGTAYLTLSGHTTSGTNTITLIAAPGDSFRDTLKTIATPLAFSVNIGTCFTLPNGVGGVNYLQITDANVIIDGLQFQDPLSTSNCTIIGGGGSPTTVRNCLLDGFGQSGGSSMLQFDGRSSITNCLLIDRQAAGSAGECVRQDLANSVFVNNTIVNPNNNTGGSAYSTFNSPTGVIFRNSAIFGYSVPFGTNATGTTVDHSAFSATSLATVTSGTGNLLSRTAANQFVSATTDFRLMAGADCLNTGVTDTTDIPSATDIIGTTRPQGTAWDIGAWEFFAASTVSGSASFFVIRCVASLGLVNTSPLFLATDPTVTGLSSTGQTSSTVTLTWGYQSSLNLMTDPLVPLGLTTGGITSTAVTVGWSEASQNLLIDSPASTHSFVATNSINFSVVATAVQRAPITGSATIFAIRVSAFAGQGNVAIARNSINFGVTSLASVILGATFAETSFSGITGTTLTGQTSFTISLSWLPPTTTLAFPQVQISATLVAGSTAVSNALFIMGMRAAGQMTSATTATGSASFFPISSVATAVRSTPASSTQTIMALTASGQALSQFTFSGQANIDFRAVGNVQQNISLINFFTIRAVGSATPVLTFTGKSNIDWRLVSFVTQSILASCTRTLTTMSASGQITQFLTAGGIASFFPISAIIILGSSMSGRANILNLTAIASAKLSQNAQGLASFLPFSVFHPDTLFLTAEDLTQLLAETGGTGGGQTTIPLKADFTFTNAGQADGLVGRSTLFTMSATGLANPVLPPIASATLTFFQIQPVVSMSSSTNASGTSHILDITGNGILNYSFTAVNTIMVLTSVQPLQLGLLADPFGIALLSEPDNVPLTVDGSIVNVIQQLTSSGINSINFTAAATALIANSARLLRNIDFTSTASMVQGNLASATNSINFTAVSTALMIGGVAGTANIDFRVSATMASNTSASATSNINFTGSGTASSRIVASATVSIVPITAAATVIMGTGASARQNIDFTASGNAVFTNSASLTRNIDITASGTVAQNTTASATVNQSFTVVATANQFITVSAINNIVSLSAVGQATNTNVAQGRSDILDLSATGNAVIVGSLMSGTGSINFTAVGQAKGATQASATVTVLVINADPLMHLWLTPIGYVEGEQIVYWTD